MKEHEEVSRIIHNTRATDPLTDADYERAADLVIRHAESTRRVVTSITKKILERDKDDGLALQLVEYTTRLTAEAIRDEDLAVKLRAEISVRKGTP